MKDYTVMHACGLEQYEARKQEAFREARKHRKLCELEETIFVDESEDRELNGNHWEF